MIRRLLHQIAVREVLGLVLLAVAIPAWRVVSHGEECFTQIELDWKVPLRSEGLRLSFPGIHPAAPVRDGGIIVVGHANEARPQGGPNGYVTRIDGLHPGTRAAPPSDAGTGFQRPHCGDARRLCRRPGSPSGSSRGGALLRCRDQKKWTCQRRWFLGNHPPSRRPR